MRLLILLRSVHGPVDALGPTAEPCGRRRVGGYVAASQVFEF